MTKESDEKTNSDLSEVRETSEENNGHGPHCVELPENMPPEVKRIVQTMTSMSAVGPVRPHNPLFDKFNDSHINKYLDYIQEDDNNAYKLQTSNRWFHLAYVLIGVAVFLFLLVYLLPTDKALFDQIFKMFVTFAGGFGTGYGVKKYKDRSN